jgi:hypothetical protein
MLVAGVLTLTMVQAAIAPKAVLRSMFGETLEGSVAEIIVRSWGALVALVGAMLIYGAFEPRVRTLVLVVAGLSKVTFVALILALGPQYLAHQAGVAVAADSVMALVFTAYLVTTSRARSAA